MSLSVVSVDAFTSVPFAGNPAAVCVHTESLSDVLQQAVASEMNLSETAFVRVLDRTTGHCALRWFTPTNEVNLCGHATLATAHALFAGCARPTMCAASFNALSPLQMVLKEAS